jgi:hypothetical protein
MFTGCASTRATPCAPGSPHARAASCHAYAQNRYEELTGWKAPASGGPDSKVLTPEQRELDREARLTISLELGHEREAVTIAYLGR